MAYTARKPCCFAGQRFQVGDSVPAEVLRPGAAAGLVEMGVLARSAAQESAGAASSIGVVIHTEKGDVSLSVSADGLQRVFDVLTGPANKAEGVISAMVENDALILLHASDGRKSVKTLAETRAKALEEAGEP